MKEKLYTLGRLLQFLALLFLPYSLWTGWIGHNEMASISIFLGSIVFFWIGYGLTRLAAK